MAVSFGSLSRGSRKPTFKPSVVYGDELDNPYAAGSDVLPTWNMPQIPTSFTTPTSTPSSSGTFDLSGLPTWNMPNISTQPQSTTTTAPIVDNPYANADLNIITTGTGKTVQPFYPFEEYFGSEVAKQIGYVDKNIWNSMTDEEQKEWANRAWAKYIAGQQQGNVPSGGGGGGGGVSGAYADALRDYVANLGSSGMDYQALIDAATSRYGGYGDTLTADVAAATAKQQAAAEQARQMLAGLMPSTVSSITPADIGAGTASNYLRSIGASTGEVDALRAMEQQMLASSLAGTQAYSQRVADVEAANRLAQQAAVETILQAASSGLATTEADRRTQYSEALAAEVERLQAAQQAQQADLANRLLEARLMAAQSGVQL